MAYPNHTLNRLPRPAGLSVAEWWRHQFRPGPQALRFYQAPDDPDPELVIEAMQEGLVAGLARLQGRDMPPLLGNDPALAPLFAPTAGRCLWTLETLVMLDQVQADPELLDLAPLFNLSLQASHAYPPALQGITPRLALALTGMRPAEFVRVARWLAEQGHLPVRPTQRDTYSFLSVQAYGGGHDARLETLALPTLPDDCYLPPRNSKRSLEQQWALVHSEHDDPYTPLPEVLLHHPPLAVELGPDLHRAFHDAVGELRRLARRAQALDQAHTADPYLRDIWAKVLSWELERLEGDVVSAYLSGEWAFERLYSDAMPAQQHITLALLRCLAQHRYRAALWRYQQPHTVLAISLVSGISPAVFARSNLAQWRRTGIPFLNEAHVDGLAQWVRQLPPARSNAAQSRRLELANELEELLEATLAMVDALPPSRVVEADRLCHSRGLPAWGVGEDDALDDD